ncbi:aldo/keto reductase [Candidatus Sumerlaeota bacterium]|nr:aldo/keto reductase [Candidatus Sumerlaeota bacterium]
MEYTQLGKTGLQVSRFCLGTMNFGNRTPEDESHEIMDKALELGFNFFDTANIYGAPRRSGATETVVGNWLAKGDGRRERIVLATKVYNAMGEGPNDRGLSAYHIRKACEDSLRRLQTDHIDLYQMHHIHRDTPPEEIWQAMEQLVREGKIVYVGSSNFPGWHIAQMCETASKRNFLGLVSEQCPYSLAQRTVELEVLPAAKTYGLAVIPWSPLEGGLLGGMAKAETEGARRTTGNVQKKFEKHRDKVEKYETFCDELGHRPAHVALAWLLAHPAITSPIIGPRTMEQLAESLPALEIALDDETLKRLDEIWPGPGGPAPEAYSW